MIGNAIFAKTTGDPTVAALLGTRMWADDIPAQGRTFPAAAYHIDDSAFPGTLTGSAGVASVMVQIESYARTKAESEQLALAIFSTLDRKSGTWGGIVVQGAFAKGVIETLEMSIAGETYRVWVSSMNYLVWFNL